MNGLTEKLDELLEKPCYIIDIFPQKVSKTANGQYFEIEYYLRNSSKYQGIGNKFTNIILKLMCYYHVSVLRDDLIDRPKPEMIEQAVAEIINNHSARLNVLFPDENSLLVIDGDCLNLSVYNPNENMQTLIAQIALSEGLFWRKSEVC